MIYFTLAHANTLRGLVKTIDNISEENIVNIAIPTVRKLTGVLRSYVLQPIHAGAVFAGYSHYLQV